MITKEYLVFLDRATLHADLRIPDFDHVWVEQPACKAEEAADLLWRATVAITNKTPITRAVLEACPKLRLIAVAATGVKPEDVMATLEKLGELKSKGILTQEEFDAKKAELLKKLV